MVFWNDRHETEKKDEEKSSYAKDVIHRVS